MTLVSTSKYVLFSALAVALAVIGCSTALVALGQMQSGDFLTLVLVILASFGLTGVVHATGTVIQQTNGAKETTTTVVPSSPASPVTVTTVKEPSESHSAGE